MCSKIFKDSISQWVNQIKDTHCFVKNSTITEDKTFLHSDWHIPPDIINPTARDQQQKAGLDAVCLDSVNY